MVPRSSSCMRYLFDFQSIDKRNVTGNRFFLRPCGDAMWLPGWGLSLQAKRSFPDEMHNKMCISSRPHSENLRTDLWRPRILNLYMGWVHGTEPSVLRCYSRFREGISPFPFLGRAGKRPSCDIWHRNWRG